MCVFLSSCLPRTSIGVLQILSNALVHNPVDYPVVLQRDREKWDLNLQILFNFRK